MRLGLIARADDGGLGSLTQEFARHLKVDRALVVDLGHKARGVTRYERIQTVVEDVRSTGHPIPDEEIEWLVKDLDVVYTAETPYSPNLFAIAKEYKCRVVLHAMPELLKSEHEDCEVWLPTDWHADRIKHSRIIPVPIALDRFVYKQRGYISTMLHIAGEAMLDRNGTDLLMQALPLVQTSLKLIMAGSQMPRRVYGNVLVESRPPVKNYWENYTEDIDLLVMPRRYGGLSMPVQEAAACGIPTLMLDLPPQRDWPVLKVPSQSHARARMAGGTFEVYSTSPEVLAQAIDAACSPKNIFDISEAARNWAVELGWLSWIDIYNKSLDALRSA
jgi:glycosyltransferase involved in cell wall biosynthesis